MSILQWNCRGYRGNFEDLKALIRDQESPDCICLQETFHGNTAPNPPRGYSLMAGAPVVENNPHSRPSRGIITLIKQNIPYYPIAIDTPLEAIAFRINLTRELTICNIYITPTEEFTTEQLHNLLQQLPPPFLLVGDFNARSEVWGDSLTNQHGRKIENLLLTSDIIIMNTGLPTHIHLQTGTESCIDLSICSPCLATEMTWETVEDSYNSDHYPIIIKQITNSQPNDNPSTAYNFEKADWTRYKSLTIVSNEFFDASKNIDNLVEDLNTIIYNAADSSIPKKQPNPKYPVPWWNSECSRTQAERKRAMRRYRRTKSLGDKIALNRATAEARKVKRAARKESWKRYLSSINSDTPINKHWAKISKIKGKYKGHKAVCLMENNQTITNQAHVANILANHFSETSSSSFYSDQFNSRRERTEHNEIDFTTSQDLCYNLPITKQEFSQALRKCQNKAPGNDNICYLMIANLSQSAQLFLLFIFNQIYVRGEIPTSWKLSILIPIPKPDKPKTSKNSYRPIALTSCVCKLLEKIINARLVHHLEENNFFSPYQYGFRKNRSTIDPLTKLQSDIHQSFKNKQHTIAVFLTSRKHTIPPGDTTY